MNIYSVKNEKLNFFNRPVYCETENEALSYIQNILMSDSDRALASLKGDLALYYLGEIDFVTGNIVATSAIKVCDLEEIFNTIPADKLKPVLTLEHYEILSKAVSELSERLNSVSNVLDHHSHNKKGGISI